MTVELARPLIAEPLSVDVDKDEIVLDGALPVTVALTPEAALETGIELVNAAMKIDPDAAEPA